MRLSSCFLFSLFFLVVAILLVQVEGHGYLCKPPPRGIEKEKIQVDDLKSPNTKGLCRGEPVGQITQATPGGPLTLEFTITAPHIGPCSVTLLDENLQNPIPIASKDDCAAPGKVGPWTITLPSNVQGRRVLRWYWEAHHRTPAEQYEQCIDLDFGGGGSYSDKPAHNVNTPTNDGSTYTPTNDGSTYTPSNDGSAYTPPNDDSVKQGGPATYPTTPVKQTTYKKSVKNRLQDVYTVGDNVIPMPPPPPPPTPAPTADSGCQYGAMRCCDEPGKWEQCDNGHWVQQLCSPGTACQKYGDSAIMCG